MLAPGTALSYGTAAFKYALITFQAQRLKETHACRLTDKMMMNHQNTACLAGCINPPVIASVGKDEADELCTIMCKCNKEPVKSKGTGRDMKQECVKQCLDKKDTPPGTSDLKTEISYNMTGPPKNHSYTGKTV